MIAERESRCHLAASVGVYAVELLLIAEIMIP